MINNNTYSVYVHLNKINGKIYVGTTSKVPASKRWCRNGIGYKNNHSKFYADILEFGWDNFEHQIIASNLTLDEASHMEKLLIDKLKTKDDNYGYNTECGGLPPTELDRRKKISNSISGEKHPLYGKEKSKETKEKIRQALLGENGYWYGKKMPPEVGAKISQKMIGNKNYVKFLESWRKPIKCVETDEVYESTAEAERTLGINHSAICMVLKGKRNTAGGFHWVYV